MQCADELHAYRNCKPLLIRSWQQSLGGSTSSTGFKFNFSLSNNNNKVKWSHKTLKKQTTKTFLQFFNVYKKFAKVSGHKTFMFMSCLSTF